MQIHTLNDIVKRAQQVAPIVISVAQAADGVTLWAVTDAQRCGIVKRVVLFGDRYEIERLADKMALNLSDCEIVHASDHEASTWAATRLVHDGDADCLVKGLVHTGTFLRAVLDRQFGLYNGRTVGHVGIVESPLLDRLILCTDGAALIAPTFEQKVQLAENLVLVARVLGVEVPKIAILAATEQVIESMPASVDAAHLVKKYRAGWLQGQAIVDGPYGLDNAVSVEAARLKGVNRPMAGLADALLAHDLETAVALVKAAVRLGGAKVAGILAGAGAPVVLISRSDSNHAKVVSIAVAALLARAYPRPLPWGQDVKPSLLSTATRSTERAVQSTIWN